MIQYQKMPKEEKYVMEVVTARSSPAQALLDLWQSRMDSGEWPIKIKNK